MSCKATRKSSPHCLLFLLSSLFVTLPLLSKASPDAFLTPPVVAQPIADFFTIPGADDWQLPLDQVFEDDGGDPNLTYSVTSNSGTYTSAAIAGEFLTLSFPAAQTDTAEIILRATDLDGMWVEDTFWVKTVAPEVLYRINAGGEALAALDAPNPGWETDYDTSPSIYHNSGNTKGNTGMNARGATLPAYAPDDLFKQERWDGSAAPEMQWEFPAGAIGIYEIHLFFMNNYGGTSAVGQRVFDVIVEGDTLLDNYDIVADAGHKIGTMKTLFVYVGDGVLDIDFGHVVENPLINAIEIVGPPVPPNNGVLSTAEQTIHIPVTEVGVASASYSVHLSNTGTDPILVSSATVTGAASGDFAVTGPLPLSLDPGQSTTLQVVFTPSGIGVVHADLEISHNAGNGSPLVISLAGEGMPVGATASVLYRVNAGGAATAAADASSPLWAEDQVSGGTTSGTAVTGTTSPFLAAGGTHADGTAVAIGSDGSLLPQVPASVLQTVREDLAGGADMTWTFPVDSGHLILTRLYFAENSAVAAGARVFDVTVEGLIPDGMAAIDVYDIAGGNRGTVMACTSTMLDDQLNITFGRQMGDPMVAAIEIVDLGLISIDFDASFVIHPGVSDVNKSTYGNKSFILYNNSELGGKITSVTLDISTGVMDEMVFDPYGTAGDLVAKDFTIDTDPVQTGYVSHSLGLAHGNGGYQSVTVNFNDFEPGENFGFSIDVDPTSTEGMPQPGPNDNASVSGLEMIGGTVTVTFAGGNTYSTRLFSDGSQAGVIACVRADLPAAPTLSIQGGGTTLETEGIYHTLSITGGEPNGTVALLEAEAGFFETAPGAQNQEPYEMNSIVRTRRVSSIQLDGTGAGLIRVIPTKTDPEAGYNFYMVASEDNGCFSSASNPVIIRYNPSGDNVRAFYLNAGGNGFISDNRDIFGKDEYFSPFPGKKSNNGSPVANTSDAAMYQADHWDNVPFSWSLPTGNGDMEVTLYFAETYFNAAGSRKFQVDLEGAQVLNDFDIYAEALADPGNGTGSGKLYAVSKTFFTTVTDGTLDLSFYKGATGADNPKVNGIQVKPVPAPTFPVIWDGELSALKTADGIALSWGTLTETNTAAFVVERSVDGKHFDELGHLIAAGQSSEPLAYHFLDRSPSSHSNRYRIRQVDQNGASMFSNTVEVWVHTSQIAVFPNPAKDLLTIGMPEGAGTAEVSLSDIQGNVVLRSVYSGNGSEEISLNVNNLPEGVYVVSVYPAAGTVFHGKVLIRR